MINKHHLYFGDLLGSKGMRTNKAGLSDLPDLVLITSNTNLQTCNQQYQKTSISTLVYLTWKDMKHVLHQQDYCYCIQSRYKAYCRNREKGNCLFSSLISSFVEDLYILYQNDSILVSLCNGIIEKKHSISYTFSDSLLFWLYKYDLKFS